MNSRSTILSTKNLSPRLLNPRRSVTRLLRSCSRTSGVQPRHPAYQPPVRLARRAQARPSELPLVPTSSVSSTSSPITSGEETPDWSFKTSGNHSPAFIPRRLDTGDLNSGSLEVEKSSNTLKKVHFIKNRASGFTFRGPVTVETELRPSPREFPESRNAEGPRETQREKKIRRQFAVDLTSAAEKEETPSVYGRQSSLEVPTIYFENERVASLGDPKPSGKTKNRIPQVSFEDKRDSRCLESSSRKPKNAPLLGQKQISRFSRSATLEWTFEGPSSHVPSSDWIDSFTRQHGIAGSSFSQQRRSSFANIGRSSLDNPRTAIKHRVLSKSPSAPSHNLNSKSLKDYGSTNSSFEHHATDPIPNAPEFRVLVHQTPASAGIETSKKQEKSCGSWSKKLGIASSQFLATGWTISTKRSPTYPLISPTSQSHKTLGSPPSDSASTSIEMTGSADGESLSIDFSGCKSAGKMKRAFSSETSWIAGNSSIDSADGNPVRRRIPVAKLHRSPSKSGRSQLDTVVQINASGTSGWLSIARNQHAKIKKCRALGKLYTTVKLEDDDVSVLVTTDQ